MLLMISPKSAPASSRCPTSTGWSLLVEEPACRSSRPGIFSCKISWEKTPIKSVRHVYGSWSWRQLYVGFMLGFWHSPCCGLWCIWNYCAFLYKKAGPVFAVPLTEMKYNQWEQATRVLVMPFQVPVTFEYLCRCHAVRLALPTQKHSPFPAATCSCGSQSLSHGPVCGSGM